MESYSQPIHFHGRVLDSHSESLPAVVAFQHRIAITRAIAAILVAIGFGCVVIGGATHSLEANVAGLFLCALGMGASFASLFIGSTRV